MPVEGTRREGGDALDRRRRPVAVPSSTSPPLRRPAPRVPETLRDRADAAGVRPKIFLANLGRIADSSLGGATRVKNPFEGASA